MIIIVKVIVFPSSKGSRKKNLLLMARPLRPTPPPLEQNGTLENEVSKKVLFSLIARPLREELFLRMIP